MLKRKIYERITEFYKNNTNKALLITGARQVGKSYIIDLFAKENYKHYIKIDFVEDETALEIFKNVRSADDILLRLSAAYGNDLVPNETIIFFDEIQECPEIITQIKYLVSKSEYDYILSGSLLGTIFKDLRSVPVGYMGILKMYPLDLEEFAYANGVSENVINNINKCFSEKKPVDDFIHEKLMELFYLYMIVGGMPASVQTYLNTKNLREVAKQQLYITELYKKDIAKYDKEDKLYLEDIYNLIPSELNSKNKRFILKNLNEYTKYNKYANSFLWLKYAGVALPAYVANEPVSPLVLSLATNLFKLFLNDVGLLASMYGGDIQLKILNHETNMNYGSVYENFAAQELKAHGFDLFYYNNKKMGELDFITEYNGKIIPIEIKSGKAYSRHRAMDNILGSEYNIEEGYIFCNCNVHSEGKITYYPIYMLMFLEKKELPEDIIYELNFEDINGIK